MQYACPAAQPTSTDLLELMLNVSKTELYSEASPQSTSEVSAFGKPASYFWNMIFRNCQDFHLGRCKVRPESEISAKILQ